MIIYNLICALLYNLFNSFCYFTNQIRKRQKLNFPVDADVYDLSDISDDDFSCLISFIIIDWILNIYLERKFGDYFSVGSIYYFDS